MDGSALTLPAGELIAPGAAWDAALARLSAAGLSDIYFAHGYVSLYAAPADRVEAFLFARGDDLFFMPYLRRALPGVPGRFDFETAYGYGGALASSEEPRFLDAAWQAFEAQARATGLAVGFLRCHPLLRSERFLPIARMRVLSRRTTVFVDCARPHAQIVAGYAKKDRWSLRKLAQRGVTASHASDAAALATFAELYAARMEDLEAESHYRFGSDYFDGIAALGAQRWRVHLAHHEGRAIGGCLVLRDGASAHYHLAAGRRDAQALSPGDVALDDAIATLSTEGVRSLHLGGGRTEAADDSLLRFKRKYASLEATSLVAGWVLDEPAYAQARASWAAAAPDKAARFGKYFLSYRY